MKNEVDILLVEDSPTQAEALKGLLEQNGYIVRHAINGRDGLSEVRQSKPSLIISDVMMPEMNGLELCKALKQNPATAGIPIVLLTSLSERQDIINAIEAQADYYLVKPYDPAMLLSRIESILATPPIDAQTQRNLDAVLNGDINTIRSAPGKVLDLLLVTCENAIQHNRTLTRLQNQLHELNEQLEQRVQERTADLQAEIAKRKQAEDELKKKNADWESTFNAISDWVALVDLGGTVLCSNRAGEGLLGIPFEDIVGKQCCHIMHGASMPIANCPVRKVLQTGRRAMAEMHLPNRDMWFLVTADPVFDEDWNLIGAVHVTRDITQQQRAHEQIKEQARLLELAQDAIIVHDSDGIIKYWNKGAEQIYGWPAQEAVGQNMGSLLYSDSSQFSGIMQELIRQGEWHGELQQIKQDKKGIIADSRCTLLRNGRKEFASILVINTDITEKKQLEIQFLRSQRLESIGRLASGISHDLNNILAPIQMASEMLRETALHESTVQLIDTIESSARRGAGILKQLLTFARGTEGQMLPVQVKYICNETAKIIRETFPKSISLKMAVAPDLWLAVGDATQLHQVLLNLCVNARDAMPNGGTLTLMADNVELDDAQASMTPGAKSGPYVRITLSDTGAGIATENIDKIFEPFFTTKKQGEGTGLGLSTVLGIVKGHRGFIQVKSTLGSGSKFDVYLPANPGPANEPMKADPDSAIKGNGELILLIDDEAPIRDITRQILEKNGYSVMSAQDGTEAVMLYAKHQSRIKLVMTDFMMPVMDGRATIRALRMIDPAVKIILTSGHGSSYNKSKSEQHEADAFLPKPFDAKTLLGTVKDMINHQSRPTLMVSSL